MTALQMPLGSSLGRKWTKDEKIADARNLLCKAALEMGVEYLFMLGDDVLPPPNVLLELLDKIGREYPVRSKEGEVRYARASMVTGIYWTKTYPPEPYIFRLEDGNILAGTYKNWKAGEFFDIDVAGCDCLLIETKMLRELPEPWFSTEWVWEEGQSVSSIATEDYYFYTKAREHGFRLFADTSLQCTHEDRETGAQFGLSMDMHQAGGIPLVGEDEVLIADLGAGLNTPGQYFGNNAKIVRFDMRESVKPDFRCDITRIDSHHFGKFDIVVAHHVLEHFRRKEAEGILAHWVKLLKPGGKIHIHVPNFERAVKFILDPPADASATDRVYAWSQVYGDQAEGGPPWQHLNGFTKRKLRAALEQSPGLGDVTIEEEHDGLNLHGTATLKVATVPYALATAWKKIAANEGQVDGDQIVSVEPKRAAQAAQPARKNGKTKVKEAVS
jgi:hypothetical protein